MRKAEEKREEGKRKAGGDSREARRRGAEGEGERKEETELCLVWNTQNASFVEDITAF